MSELNKKQDRSPKTLHKRQSEKKHGSLHGVLNGINGSFCWQEVFHIDFLVFVLLVFLVQEMSREKQNVWYKNEEKQTKCFHKPCLESNIKHLGGYSLRRIGEFQPDGVGESP